jgi:hypothetical protein
MRVWEVDRRQMVAGLATTSLGLMASKTVAQALPVRPAI